MFGGQRHNKPYYLCWPRNNNRGRPDKYEGHPKTVYLREDHVLDAVSRFFADRVFGPHRRELLAADLDGIDDRATRQRQAECERLQRVLADIARRQNSILRQAQDGDPDDPSQRAYEAATTSWKPRRRPHSPPSPSWTPPAKPSQADPARTTRPTARPGAEPRPRPRGAAPAAVRGHSAHRPTAGRQRPRHHHDQTARRPTTRHRPHSGKDQRSHAIYTRSACSAGVNRLCRCCTCPRSGSNRHLDDFKSSASASWATGAFGLALRSARRTGYDAAAVRSVPKNRRTCSAVGSVTSVPARSSRPTGPRSGPAPSRAPRSRRLRSRPGVRTSASRS